MSHNIEFRNGRAQAMYVGAKAWHGLGQMFDSAPDIDTAFTAAGLDVTHSLRSLYMSDGAGNWIKVDRYAVVRDTDGRVHGTVGPDYRIVQNAAAKKFLRPFLDAGAVEIEAAGSLRGGARMWVLCKVKRDGKDIVKGDKVESYLLFANGHDGSLAVHLGSTAVRVVCDNTVAAAVNAGTTIRVRHTQSAEKTIAAVADTMARANQNFDKACEAMRALAGKYVTEKQVRAYIDAVFPPAKKAIDVEATEIAPSDAFNLPDVPAAGIGGAGDMLAGLLNRPARISAGTESEIETMSRHAQAATDSRRIQDNILEILETGRGMDLPGVRGTMWGAYNAVTEYLTHHRGANADNRMAGVWFGGLAEKALTAATKTL